MDALAYIWVSFFLHELLPKTDGFPQNPRGYTHSECQTFDSSKRWRSSPSKPLQTIHFFSCYSSPHPGAKRFASSNFSNKRLNNSSFP
jgi:hypothetical protein